MATKELDLAVYAAMANESERDTALFTDYYKQHTLETYVATLLAQLFGEELARWLCMDTSVQAQLLQEVTLNFQLWTQSEQARNLFRLRIAHATGDSAAATKVEDDISWNARYLTLPYYAAALRWQLDKKPPVSWVDTEFWGQEKPLERESLVSRTEHNFARWRHEEANMAVERALMEMKATGLSKPGI